MGRADRWFQVLAASQPTRVPCPAVEVQTCSGVLGEVSALITAQSFSLRGPHRVASSSHTQGSTPGG